MSDEVDFHLEQRAADLVRRGMDPVLARQEAERRFGSVHRVREEMEAIDRAVIRSGRLRDWWGGFALDFRHARRGLRKNSVFTASVTLILALGIGVTTTLFGVVDSLFLRPPAGVRGAEQLVRVSVVRDDGSVRTGPEGGPGSYLEKGVMADEVPGLVGVAAFTAPTNVDVGEGQSIKQVAGSAVSQDYFSVLGVQPSLGRFFLPGEDSVPARDPVAVISHSHWQREFGGSPDVLGTTLLINRQPMTVIGVAEGGFAGVDAERIEVWIPSAMAGPVFFQAGAHEWRTIPTLLAVHFVARLAPGANAERMAGDVTTALRRLAANAPDMDPTPEVRLDRLVPAARPQHSTASRLSLWLLAMAGIVLVIAVANVANLLLARATAKRQEFAVRVSLGASRARMLQHHLVETMLLALGGAAAGVGVAAIGVVVIRRFPLPPSAGEFHLRPIGFAIALALVTGLIFGLVPAVRSFQDQPAQSLRDNQAGEGKGRARGRRLLLTGQVALSLMLSIGAGLFLRSAQAVNSIDAGFAYDRLLVASANFEEMTGPEVETFFDAAQERLQQVPGVEGTTTTHFSPFSGMRMPVEASVAGTVVASGSNAAVANLVGSDYFDVVGTRIVQGRGLTREDRAGTAGVVVVNETLAEQLASRLGSVLGQCVQLSGIGDGCARIVGVAEDQRTALLRGQASPEVFLPRSQAAHAVPFGAPALLIRTDDPAGRSAEVRAALQTLRPGLPYLSVKPFEDHFQSELLPHRLGTMLFALFGGLALVLAGIGLHGVLAYFVGQRRPEIGVRRALGASEGDILALVLRHAALPLGLGIAIGVAAAFVGGRYLETLLYQISGTDPTVYAVASMFMIAVALIASVIPAREAASVQPTTALRR